MSLKAFVVACPDHEHSAITFARSNIEARKWGASEWNDGELRGMSCTRIPGFDCYHETEVPASEMVEIGWWFECSNCDRRIDNDDDDENRIIPSEVIGTQYSAVYCNAACRDEHLARKARERSAGDNFLAMIRERIKSRFGPVDFVVGAFREHLFAQEVDGVVLIRDACLSFSFPGQLIGPASVRYQPKYIVGPCRLEVFCCAGDAVAFEAFAGINKEGVIL